MTPHWTDNWASISDKNFPFTTSYFLEGHTSIPDINIIYARTITIKPTQLYLFYSILSLFRFIIFDAFSNNKFLFFNPSSQTIKLFLH